MSGHPRKGTKYTILKIELLVPVGAEMFMDLLSDFRDDNPDELVEWAQAPNSIPSMTREQAIKAWQVLHNETLSIKEREE